LQKSGPIELENMHLIINQKGTLKGLFKQCQMYQTSNFLVKKKKLNLKINYASAPPSLISSSAPPPNEPLPEAQEITYSEIFERLDHSSDVHSIQVL
jgi:hypothetical protein